ncbi:MAG: Holliday junction branch migration protein RuvA [Oscillospiraceae bacterium]|nr:Holliday junction branch migration protein RuvA [Oscillospiraceae bacterium]
MFYHINGTLTELEPNLAVLDCAGVGFAVNITMNTAAGLSVGDRIKLFISEAIGESNFDLYGFQTKSEKRCFEMLISVSGIGPKAAMSILSHNSPESLALAIMSDDIKALTVAPGIGKKIAQRVILELKDKINKETGGVLEIQLPAVSAVSSNNAAVNDAIMGLGVLGYSSAEISPVIKELDVEKMTAEQIIKAVLKRMVK